METLSKQCPTSACFILYADTVETVIEVKRREEVDCKFDDTGGESSLKEDSSE